MKSKKFILFWILLISLFIYAFQRATNYEITSYSASVTDLATAATATDVFTITGSATKTIRVTRIQISGIATTAGAFDVALIKRSTANTAGTSSAPTLVAHDSSSAAATAVVRAYTANPTLGTAVGTLQVRRIVLTTAAAGVAETPTVIELGLRGEQPIFLRGVTEVLAVNLNGVTVTGGSFDIDVTFTEE